MDSTSQDGSESSNQSGSDDDTSRGPPSVIQKGVNPRQVVTVLDTHVSLSKATVAAPIAASGHRPMLVSSGASSSQAEKAKSNLRQGDPTVVASAQPTVELNVDPLVRALVRYVKLQGATSEQLRNIGIDESYES